MPYTLPTGYANITPRIIVVDDANGNTLTRASFLGLTKEYLEDQGLYEVGLARLIASAKEARMAGVAESSLSDLLTSRMVSLKESRAKAQGSFVQPFEFAPRRNVVNANYFRVTAGNAHPSAGSNGIPAHAWQITVGIGDSPWVTAPSNGLVNLEKYFLPDNDLIVEYADANSVARVPQFKVIDAEYVSSQVAKVNIVPNYTENGWAALTADQQAVFQPTAGQVTRLANSVSDFESNGYQYPAHNNWTMAEYWNQRVRWADTYTQEYVDALSNPNSSEFFRKFQTTPLAEQKRIREMHVRNDRNNAIFWQDRINEYQSTSGTVWRGLPTVPDIADETMTLEFKANTLGIHTQLNEAGMVSDKMGQPLNLNDIFEQVYRLARTRAAQNTAGVLVDTVDAMCDRFTANAIDAVMLQYYKNRYASQVTLFYTPGQKLSFDGTQVLEYNKYYLPEHGVYLAVFINSYFDDRISAFATGQKNMARFFWLVDWSDIAVNVLDTRMRKHQTDVAAELYRYTIRQNIKYSVMNSMLLQVRVGDPNRHLIYKNFSGELPVLGDKKWSISLT